MDTHTIKRMGEGVVGAQRALDGRGVAHARLRDGPRTAKHTHALVHVDHVAWMLDGQETGPARGEWDADGVGGKGARRTRRRARWREGRSAGRGRVRNAARRRTGLQLLQLSVRERGTHRTRSGHGAHSGRRGHGGRGGSGRCAGWLHLIPSLRLLVEVLISLLLLIIIILATELRALGLGLGKIPVLEPAVDKPIIDFLLVHAALPRKVRARLLGGLGLDCERSL